MAEELTDQQRQAVTDRGGNLLVSAAAGSGKTKVLVDRVMSYLTDPVNPANLDEFLIITYTKAAAAELRGKIAAKLTELIAQQPENRHLRQQMQRLYLAKISTVHAFCTDILREYAYKMNIPTDFRVAEENECLDLQARVIEKLLDGIYVDLDNNPDFYELINTQGLGRDDRQIPLIILDVYKSARCHLNPKAWLEWCLSVSDVTDKEDVSETIWGKYLIEDLHHYLDMQIAAYENCAVLADEYGDMPKPAILLRDTAEQLKRLRSADKWDDIIRYQNIEYGSLNFTKEAGRSETAKRIKIVRDACKKGLGKKLRKFSDCSAQILEDMRGFAAAQRGLVALVQEFSNAYAKLKKSLRIMDFSDLEQATLDILLGADRSGYTAIATEIGHRFREVMVDEYQDSNAVQDAIFAAITNEKQNCFMVGDVKQSIYQFRLADPGIFLQKYNTYCFADVATNGQGRKVLLSNNFRSSGSVIDAVNDVFKVCMSTRVGGLDYGKDEALYEGIPQGDLPEPEIELYTIEVREDTYTEEAAFVAERISQLLDGTHMIRQKQGLRPIEPQDIVILLRSPGSVGGYYCDALEARGIRCTTDRGSSLLQAEEIEILKALLQVLDNPLQDIPLVALLASRVFQFTADELTQIRIARPGTIYSALCASELPKARAAVNAIRLLREEARISSLPKLMQRIFEITQIDSVFAALPDGNTRYENLQSFYKLVCDADSAGIRDIQRLLDYLSALEKKPQALTDERGVAGAVTIMSIHRSKGLEFPVVILGALSRDFSQESLRAQIYCDKDLGLGLSSVDRVNRVRYPSLAKRAIGSKIIAEGVSEEMRLLYVAMTRPKDRLIMTYATAKLEDELCDITTRLDVCGKEMLIEEVDCPGKWILLSALGRSEAGELFAKGGYPKHREVHKKPWQIRVVQSNSIQPGVALAAEEEQALSPDVMRFIEKSVAFTYPYKSATVTPSKQTATQLKGRLKDREASQDSAEITKRTFAWRNPSFLGKEITGKTYGTALHTVLQYISFPDCTDELSVRGEMARLVQMGYLTQDAAELVAPDHVVAFLSTEIGKRIQRSNNVLREFKFSILDDGNRYGPGLSDEKILLQGVVDCALIEEDGITVIDFKSDHITDHNFADVVDRYRDQVTLYATALEKIFEKPVKEKMLYFFSNRQFVSV